MGKPARLLYFYWCRLWWARLGSDQRPADSETSDPTRPLDPYSDERLTLTIPRLNSGASHLPNDVLDLKCLESARGDSYAATALEAVSVPFTTCGALTLVRGDAVLPIVRGLVRGRAEMSGPSFLLWAIS